MWRTVLDYGGLIVLILSVEWWQWYRTKWACESANEQIERRLDKIESRVMFRM